MRLYNPALGRFLSVDPISKQFPWYTPYQFAGNKPIWATDLDGMEEKLATNKGVVFHPKIKDKDIEYYSYDMGGGNEARTTDKVNWTYTAESNGFKKIYNWNSTSGKKEWTPIFDEKENYDARNQTVAQLNNGIIAVTLGTPAVIISAGAGFFAVEGLTWTGVGSGAADFTLQMASSKGDINKWNITSTVSQTVMPHPFGSAFVGSAGKVTVEDIFDKKRKTYSSIQENTISGVLLDTGVGGSFNALSGTIYKGFKINEGGVGIGAALERFSANYNANMIGNSSSTLVGEPAKNVVKDEKKP